MEHIYEIYMEYIRNIEGQVGGWGACWGRGAGGAVGAGGAMDQKVRTPAAHDLGALTVPVLTLGAMCLAAAVKRWYLEPQG